MPTVAYLRLQKQKQLKKKSKKHGAFVPLQAKKRLQETYINQHRPINRCLALDEIKHHTNNPESEQRRSFLSTHKQNATFLQSPAAQKTQSPSSTTINTTPSRHHLNTVRCTSPPIELHKTRSPFQVCNLPPRSPPLLAHPPATAKPHPSAPSQAQKCQNVSNTTTKKDNQK